MSMSKNFKLFWGWEGGTGVSKLAGLFLHSPLKCEVITKETEVFASGIEELRWGLLWASKDELHMLLRKYKRLSKGHYTATHLHT